MEFKSFWSDVLATLLGGSVLTVVLFWVKEKWFPMPDVTGQWNISVTTTASAYLPYVGMRLHYVAMVWRDGSQIAGTVEKVYEDSVNGKREFVGPNRTRGVISGAVQKNYLGPDRIFVHIVEAGHGRESTNFFDLGVLRDGTLDGVFRSMVAKQAGTVTWKR